MQKRECSTEQEKDEELLLQSSEEAHLPDLPHAETPHNLIRSIPIASHLSFGKYRQSKAGGHHNIEISRIAQKMLETHDHGTSMWVPTIYETSFEETSGLNNFVATDDSAQILPQLVRYLQELEEEDEENVPSSSCTEEQLQSRDTHFSCSRNITAQISFQASSFDTQNVHYSEDPSVCINSLPGQSYASPSENRTSWFKSPLLQDFLEKQGASFEPPRYLGAPQLITLQREQVSSRSRSPEPFEEEKLASPVGSENGFLRHLRSTKPRRLAATRSERGRSSEWTSQPYRSEQQCREFTTQDISSLYKQAINNIASELKLKIKELNEKTDHTHVTNTPTSFTNLSTRSRMKSYQFASPSRMEGAHSNHDYNLPLQMRQAKHYGRECQTERNEQPRSLAKVVKVFQQNGSGFRSRGSPTNQSQESEITNQFIFLKMIPQEESKSGASSSNAP